MKPRVDIVCVGIGLRPSRGDLAVRVEADGNDVVVSPLLGEGRLCERCWLMRRMATCDVAELGRRGETLADLLDAFNSRCARWPASPDPQQRRILARVLRGRLREARSGAVSFPPRLTVVADEGLWDEPVLPLPDCAACLQTATRLPPDHLEWTVGSKAGIVALVRDVAPFPNEPEFPSLVVTRLANTWLNPTRSFGFGASGKGETPHIARASAIAETIERYAAGVVPETVVVARSDQLDGPTIEPIRLTGSEAASAGYSSDRAIAWAPIRGLKGREPAGYVPASAVLLRLPADLPRPILVPFSSNGLACADDLETALRRAFAEVIERHVFFSVWYGARDYIAADHGDAVDPTTRKAIDAFEGCGLAVRTVLLGIEGGVHVAAASCWPRKVRTGRPRFALGLGTGEGFEVALRRAVLEMAQVYRGLTWALSNADLADRATALASGQSQIDEPYDHGLLYAERGAENVPAPFGLAPAPTKTGLLPSAPSDPLRRAVFVELTPPDVAAASGWHVVRVLVPDTIPYHYGAKQIPYRALWGRTVGHGASVLPHPLN